MKHTKALVAVATILLLTYTAAFAGSAAPARQADAAPVAPAPEYELADMLQAANAFLASLSAAQRSKASFAFEDAERLNWHFVPRARRGLPLKEMSAKPPSILLASDSGTPSMAPVMKTRIRVSECG